MLFLWYIPFLGYALSSAIPNTVPPGRSRERVTEPATSFDTQTLISSDPSASKQQHVWPEDGTAGSAVMDVFQVYKPVVIPEEAQDIHRIFLVNHSFGNSYGKPFVGSHNPPSKTFTNVHINLTVTSKGRQFDRLGILYLGDVEVFRTSTAEPTPNGIIWSYCKDMTQYLTLWKTSQKVILDLGNLINKIYTGPFNVTIEAVFFTLPSPVVTADLILPISAMRSSSNRPSAFTIPAQNATALLHIPPDVSRAVVSIAACGQADEEFWYSNVPSSLTTTFKNTTGDLYGFSSFREIQLYIDGMLAGVVWPFPIIFTGGIAPGFWRPMVGVDAFDLREFEIDIAPFIHYLTDGKQHSFEVRVVGLNNTDFPHFPVLSSSVGNHWVVTGKIFIFIDPNGPSYETHKPPVIDASGPFAFLETTLTQMTNETDQTKQNDTLQINLEVSREISIYSLSGLWHQTLYYDSYNLLTSHGLDQITQQSTFGQVQAISNRSNAPPVYWSYFFTQPLTVATNLTIFSGDQGQGIGISALIARTLQFMFDGSARPDISLFTLTSGDSKVHAYQRGSAAYSSQTNHSYSFGSTLEEFEEQSHYEHLRRSVEVVNGTVKRDVASADCEDKDDDLSFGKALWNSLIEDASAAPLGAETLTEGGAALFWDWNARARIGRGPGLSEQLPPF